MASSSPGGGEGLGAHGSWDWRQQQQQQQPADEGAKQYAPAASRNEAPILAVLTEQLRRSAWRAGGGDDGDAPGGGGGGGGGCLLEVACGTGQHAAAFSRALLGGGDGPPLLSAYLPTDLTAGGFASVRAHTAGIPGVLPPRPLDVSLPAERWFAGGGGEDGDGDDAAVPPSFLPLRAILAVNLTHISPWAATLGLLRGAARHLDPRRGLLLIYGPFTRRGGEHVGAEGGGGNARFDASLRAQDAAWGYRDVEGDVLPAAHAAGLELVEVLEMPANNLMLVLRRRRESGGD